jgi:hypothetical protein
MKNIESPIIQIKSLKANAFIKTFCTLGFIFYSAFLVVGAIVCFYAIFMGLFGAIFMGIFTNTDIGLNMDLLIILPFLNIAIFYALSLMGLIMLLRNKFKGFYIFIITQFIGVALNIYLIYIFEAFWLFGALLIIIFTFFAGMFSTQIGKYR